MPVTDKALALTKELEYIAYGSPTPKPCPFCGERAFRMNYGGNAYRQYRVRCSVDECNSGTYYFDTVEEADEAWNKRTSDKLLKTLKLCLIDAQLALDDTWDRGDEGFEAMIDNIEEAIHKVEPDFDTTQHYLDWIHETNSN